MLELNKIYNIDCLEGLRKLDSNSVDVVKLVNQETVEVDKYELVDLF